MNCRILLLSVACLGAAVERAYSLDVDVRPRVVGGRIQTNGWSDATSQEYPHLRVFGYTLGSDPAAPFFTEDPGINAPAASGLTPNSNVGFNILSGSDNSLPGNLTYWSGSNQPSFGAVPANESLNLSLTPGGSVNVGKTLGKQTGFTIEQVTSDGAMHRHFSSVLQAPGTPTSGIYLMSMQLTESDPAIAASLPYFVLYNSGLSDNLLNSANDYVTLNYAFTLGDMNGDGTLDNFDIPAFVLALTSPSGYLGKYPQLTSYSRRGDINGDNRFDNFDIPSFERLLTASSVTVVPEPSTAVLLLAGLSVVLATTRRCKKPTAAEAS